MEFLCEIRGLSVTYGFRNRTRIRAVDDLTLAIHSSEIIGILGESGCGKSTLASAILRALPDNAEWERGNIVLFGRELRTMSQPELREIRGRKVSLIPQDPALALNPVMSVGSQIAEVLRSHLPLRAKERKARVLELLSEVGFDNPQDFYGAYPHQLSGGQRQRIVIAQAICCEPSLVIADEPTSKLDPPLQAEIIALLAKIRREYGLAIVLISHDPAIFAGFADRLAVMYAGRIVEVGTTGQIFLRPLHPYTQALVQLAKSALATHAAHTRFTAIEGDSPDPGRLPAGCRFQSRCPERMEVCRQRYPQAFLAEPSRPVNCFKYGE